MPTTRPRGSRSTGLGERFYGWWIVATAVFTFGIAVGVPYYNLPFFYDYFQKTHHWKLEQITLGFPLAAALTLWIGPLLIPRFSPANSSFAAPDSSPYRCLASAR